MSELQNHVGGAILDWAIGEAKQAMKKPRTNGDRIRAMSNEELAKVLVSATCSEREYYSHKEAIQDFLEHLNAPANDEIGGKND